MKYLVYEPESDVELIKQADDEYDKIEAQAWKNYNLKLKTVKNEQEADKLYQEYLKIEEEAKRKMDVIKKSQK